MTDKMMSEKLIIYFERLERKGKASMADIFALTSSHLYGVIFRTLKDEEQSSHVLTALYEKVWDTRHLGHTTDNPLNALRAIAHRFALNYQNTGETNFKNDTLAELRLKKNGTPSINSLLSKEEIDLLQTAYLHDVAARKKNFNPDTVKETIHNIVSKMTRDQS